MKQRPKQLLSGKRFGIPTAVFILGILSTAMLFWIYSLVDRERMDFEQVDAIMDIQVRTATFHLWLEEAIAKGARQEALGTIAELDASLQFADAILSGGESENGTLLVPLDDPVFLGLARTIRRQLGRMRELALERAQNLRRGGAGSALDEEFNAVFREFQQSARTLELAVEKDRLADQTAAGRLFLITVLTWVIIVSASIIGLSGRERGRLRAEEALVNANKEMEQRIRNATARNMELQVETLRAAHLASIGKLAAGVAHEINNPINGIINYARILSNRSAKGSEDNDVSERITKEARRIAGIVKSLLMFARVEKAEKRPVSVDSILRESLTLTESQLRKEGVQLRISVPPDLPAVFANPQQIQQVFMNIISNAQHALGQKYPGAHDGKVLEISGEAVASGDEPFVRITFLDHGTGIASGHLGEVMNPFFTTKPPGEGTGLGLSISHGIIHDHGGTISVSSVEGEYTRVRIDLPAGGRHG